MNSIQNLSAACIAAACLSVTTLGARADTVTDWNVIAGELIVQSKMGTPPAVRVMAIVQTAVHEAVGAVPLLQAGDGIGMAADAAIAAANRATLVKLLPQQAQATEAAYKTAWDPLESTCRHASLSIL